MATGIDTLGDSDVVGLGGPVDTGGGAGVVTGALGAVDAGALLEVELELELGLGLDEDELELLDELGLLDVELGVVVEGAGVELAVWVGAAACGSLATGSPLSAAVMKSVQICAGTVPP